MNRPAALPKLEAPSARTSRGLPKRRTVAASLGLGVLVCLLAACGTEAPVPLDIDATADNTSTWPAYGGDGARHFAASGDITPDNVKKLAKVWELHTGDVADGKGAYGATSAFEVTPILQEGILYLCTPFNRVLAVNPATGEEIWSYDPKVDLTGRFSNQLVCRGVSWWRDPVSTEESGACAARIFTATNDSRLLALDAKTGLPCQDFGGDEAAGEAVGTVSMAKGVGDIAWYGEYHHTSPPVLVGDLVIVGSAIGDNSRIKPPSGVLRAYDARSGRLVWSWDLAPPGYQPAADELTPDGYVLGTPNVWAPMVADEARDLVFVPTGNPSPDYFRPGEAPLDYYGSSLVALRASTGEIVWHYQFVHNDHWDFDTPAQPTLMDIEKEGRLVPAVVQATKMGFLFVLDRETGEPLFPVEERPVPGVSPDQVALSADILSPTQPFPVLPPPLVPIDLKPEDAFGLTPWDKGQCRKRLKSLHFEGMYTPATERPTLMMPGNAGGSNWGGIAADPDRRIVIANVMNMPFVVELLPRDTYTDIRKARQSGKVEDAHGDLAPQTGTPYGLSRQAFLSPLGLPCNQPPWGKLVAVDMTSGTILWEVPFGTVRDLAPVPLPWRLGVPNIGGPLVTESGLIFIGAAMDNYLRAYDLKTGKELWKARLPAGGQATPMSYTVTDKDGRERQFVVIAAGGHGTAGTKLGDSVIAYALPD